MGKENVIRQDVVQIGFEIEDNPFSDITTAMSSFRDEVIGAIDKVKSDFNLLGKTASGASDGIDDIIKSALELKNENLNPVSDSIKDIAERTKKATPKISTMTKDLAKLTKQKSINIFDGIKNAPTNTIAKVTSAVDWLGKSFVKIKNNISFKGIVSSIDTGIGKGLNGAVNGAKKLFPILLNISKTSMNTLASGIGKVSSGLATAGKFAMKGLGKATVATTKMLGGAVVGLGAAASASAVGIFKLTNMASDLGETTNKVTTAFGKKTGNSVLKWSSSSITQMGLAKQTALDMTALFGDMGTSMGISQKESATMSMSLTQLGADLASFKNINIDEATTALNGVFTGETESLKRLGVVMTQTNLEQFAMSKGITKQVKAMTEAEKVNLRYAYVMEKTKNAQGDFVKTGGGFANQLRMFKEQFKELGTSIGGIFLPNMAKGMQALNGFSTELNGVFVDGWQSGDLNEISDILTRALDTGVKSLQKGLPKVIDFLVVFLSSLTGLILSELPKIVQMLLTGVVSLFSSVIDIIRQNKDSITASIVELARSLVDALAFLVPEILLLGAEIIMSLVSGIAKELPTLIPTVISAMQELSIKLYSMIPQLMDVGIELIMGILDGMVNSIPMILQNSTRMMQVLIDGITTSLPKIIEASISIINTLVTALIENLPLLLNSALTLINALVTGLIQNLPVLINGAIAIVNALLNGIVGCLPMIISAAVQMINALVNGLIVSLPIIISATLQLVMALVMGLIQNLPMIIQSGITLILALLKGLLDMLPLLIDGAIQLLMGLVMGLIDNLDLIISAAIQIIIALTVGLISAIPEILGAIPKITMALIDGLMSVNWLSVGWDIISGIGKGIWDGVKGIFGGGKKKGQEATSGLSEGITSSSYQPVKSAQDTASGVTSGLQLNTTQIGGYGTSAMSSYSTGLSQNATMPTMVAKDTASGIKSSLSTDLYSTGKATATSYSSGIGAMNSTAIANASSLSSDVQNAAQTKIPVQVETDEVSFKKVQSASKKTVDACTKVFDSGFKKISSITSTTMNNIALSIASTSLYSSGQNIMQGLNNGMASMRSQIEKTARGIANSVKNTINKSLEINSPSKATFKTGVYTAEGQELGMLSKLADVKSAATKVADTSLAVGRTSSEKANAYTPEKSAVASSSVRSETNYYSPQFTLNIEGGSGDRDTERKVRQWIKEGLRESFESMGRRNPRLTEV